MSTIFERYLPLAGGLVHSSVSEAQKRSPRAVRYVTKRRKKRTDRARSFVSASETPASRQRC